MPNDVDLKKLKSEYYKFCLSGKSYFLSNIENTILDGILSSELLSKRFLKLKVSSYLDFIKAVKLGISDEYLLRVITRPFLNEYFAKGIEIVRSKLKDQKDLKALVNLDYLRTDLRNHFPSGVPYNLQYTKLELKSIFDKQYPIASKLLPVKNWYNISSLNIFRDSDKFAESLKSSINEKSKVQPKTVTNTKSSKSH